MKKTTPGGLQLAELTRVLHELAPTLSGDARVVVTDVEQDSRRVQPGALFVARSGARSDGVRFVADAVAQGAAAVMLPLDAQLEPLPVPVLRVRDMPRALAFAAEAVHGWPSHHVAVAGVTGTNGKTTVTWLVQRALGGLGVRAARMGTLGFEFEQEREDIHLTTPEADMASRCLARVKQSGGTHAVMEVSSVALVQARADALRFEVAAFTNLTRDHLDFHGSFDAYRQAKARLFRELAPRVAVINTDDEFGRDLAREAKSAVVSVGSGAGVDGSALECSPRGVEGRVAAFGHEVELRSSLIGRHNAENLTLAFGILHALGVEPERAARALSDVGPAPGRLERCDGPGDDLVVLVDYAHTPDALERVLSAVKPAPPARLVCVFGCGGDRDPGKREPMGRAVGDRADHAIITNDNPRREAPQAIAAAVERGLRRASASYEVYLDRAGAIERAVLNAAGGDVVLIAGKGHETYQLIGGREIAFDDREHARRALAQRRRVRGAAAWPR